jgi:hypothetical protein
MSQRRKFEYGCECGYRRAKTKIPGILTTIKNRENNLGYGPAALVVDLKLNGLPYTPMDPARKIIQDASSTMTLS